MADYFDISKWSQIIFCYIRDSDNVHDFFHSDQVQPEDNLHKNSEADGRILLKPSR